jgi:beta-glucosidase
VLPVATNTHRKAYVEGMDKSVVAARGYKLVSSSETDIAFIRLKSPYVKRPGGFEALFHARSLKFSAEEKERQAAIYKEVPSVVDMYLDRPSVIPELVELSAAVFVGYGSSGEAF